MCKHRGGFPEGQSPIVLDTFSNAEYNIKYLKKKQKNKNKQKTVYNILQEHNNEYSFILPMSLKSSFTYYSYPTQSLDIVIIHMSDYQVTMYSDNF